MSSLTRRHYPERSDCWHVYYGDLKVGTIARRAGVPIDVDQWGWDCGFYPLSHRGVSRNGTAATFEAARSNFGAAWRDYLPQCTEAAFQEWRASQAWNAWKSKMWEIGRKLPSQTTIGRSKCFCGVGITIRDVSDHVCSHHLVAA